VRLARCGARAEYGFGWSGGDRGHAFAAAEESMQPLPAVLLPLSPEAVTLGRFSLSLMLRGSRLAG